MAVAKWHIANGCHRQAAEAAASHITIRAPSGMRSACLPACLPCRWLLGLPGSGCGGRLPSAY